MIRYFEKQDKEDVLKLASDFHGVNFDSETFGEMLDGIAEGNEMCKGISVLHAGEYLGYCVFYIMERTLIVNQLYIKPAFQKLKVSSQVFDFIEAHYPDYTYKAVCPADNKIAIKIFRRRGYEVITK